MAYLVERNDGAFFAGTTQEEGYLQAHWEADKESPKIRTFASKDAAERVVDAFGGTVVKE